jgi:hypothetical protein
MEPLINMFCDNGQSADAPRLGMYQAFMKHETEAFMFLQS